MLPVTKLQSGRTLLVDGPASIRLMEGEADCFGMRLVHEQTIAVKPERRVPVEAVSELVILEVKTSEGSSVREVAGSTIPGGWVEAGQIVQQSHGTVVILGEVDSGKSSLSSYLANIASEDGLKVNVVDADIGQADIGPPTTIGGAMVNRGIQGLQDLDPVSAYFVGDTSPSLVSDKVSNGTIMVRSHLESSDVQIINTDGWVLGPEAVRYKLSLLEKLKPDIIIALTVSTDERQLAPILDQQDCAIIRLGPSAHARSRSREERKRARESGYRRFLDGSHRRELRLDKLTVKPFNSKRAIDLSNIHPVRGLLTGLINEEDGMLSGIARLRGVRNRRVTLETKFEGPDPGILEFGTVLLSPNYEESGFLHVGFRD